MMTIVTKRISAQISCCSGADIYVTQQLIAAVLLLLLLLYLS